MLKQPWADRVDWSEAANTAAGRGRLALRSSVALRKQHASDGGLGQHPQPFLDCGDSDPVMAGRIRIWLRKC